VAVYANFAIFATITRYKIATKQHSAPQIIRLLASAEQRRVQILGRNTSKYSIKAQESTIIYACTMAISLHEVERVH